MGASTSRNEPEGGNDQFSPAADYGKQSVDPKADYRRCIRHGAPQASRGCFMGEAFTHASRAASPVTNLAPPGVVFPGAL